MSDTQSEGPAPPPGLSLFPSGVCDRQVHTKEVWFVRVLLLWLAAAIAVAFPWPGSDTMAVVLSWLGAVVGSGFVVYVAWRWVALRIRTGSDLLHRPRLAPRRQTTVRAVAAVGMGLFVVTLWTPAPIGVPYVWVLMPRAALIAAVVLLVAAMWHDLFDKPEPQPAAGEPPAST